MQGGNYDPNEISFDNILKLHSTLNDLMMEEDDQMMIAGQILIADFKKMTVAHSLAFTPSLLKKVVVFVQEGSPIRLKGIHYINMPSWYEKILNLFKSLMNEKTKSRVSKVLIR